MIPFRFKPFRGPDVFFPRQTRCCPGIERVNTHPPLVDSAQNPEAIQFVKGLLGILFTFHLDFSQRLEFKEIPWRMLKGIRNVLAHEYFGVDLDIIWKTIKDDLPKLKKQLID